MTGKNTTEERNMTESAPALTAQPSAAADRKTSIRDLLEELVAAEGSDLHLTVGQAPKLRVDGILRDSTTWTDKLTPKETIELAYSLLTEKQKRSFEVDDELDFSFGVARLSRFRANVFRQRGAVALAIRQIPFEILDFDKLGLPPVVESFAERVNGMVLVTGSTGSGKSTTLAALIDKINRHKRLHILTIEDPIEFIHNHRSSMVNQREVGSDTKSFANALKYALRQDPDVILVGEMRDPETIGAAITMAETGHLVFATLHSNSAAETINRIIDVFPHEQQPQIRTQLAAVLEGIVTQQLIPKKQGGRTMAAEVLVVTPAIRALVRDGKTHQIYSSMQAGGKHGMQTMNQALFNLWLSGTSEEEEIMNRSEDHAELNRLIAQHRSGGSGG
ncbi:MAG TPA: type IV pilus twitching motility protein PilT [Gemmatimonadota bacterium]|nr:type IV pilus twitching motility protein PilT [Gemmatimonadota bacterium]